MVLCNARRALTSFIARGTWLETPLSARHPVGTSSVRVVVTAAGAVSVERADDNLPSGRRSRSSCRAAGRQRKHAIIAKLADSVE